VTYYDRIILLKLLLHYFANLLFLNTLRKDHPKTGVILWLPTIFS